LKKWTDEFIARCLDGLPPHSEYRCQIQKELEDHLVTLALDLEEDGFTSQAARARALSFMGSPEKLNQSYRVRFFQRRFKDPFYVMGRFFALALLTGAYYVLTWCFLGTVGFTADITFADRVSFPLYGHPVHQFIFGFAIFVIPFSLNALHLRRTFRLHPHPDMMITTGLLFTWLCEKIALFALSSLLCGTSVSDIFFGGWSDVAPWLNFPYILISFSGCFTLAALFTPVSFRGGGAV